MVTRKDVAALAGVSTAVVSAAISGSNSVRMSAATRERVMAAIEATGYRVNHAGRALASKRSGIVAAVVPKISNPVFDLALQGVQDAADESSDIVLVSDAARLFTGSNMLDRIVGTGVADGFIVRGTMIGDEPIDKIIARGVPCVVLNGPTDHDHVNVWVDDHAGIRAATDHLLALGHRRIVLVGGPVEESAAKDTRRHGFLEAFRAHRAEPPVDCFHSVGYEPEEIQRTVTELLSRPDAPTGIIVDNVTASIGALAAAADLGVLVPDDLSVIGYHDISLAALIRPAITTIRMPVRESGRQAYRTLAQMIMGEGPGETQLINDPPPELVVRASTGPVRPATTR
ncbi:LacI family DNA-binding transcriptional regulator [Propionibacteriaceae bacterium Y2011]